MGKAAIIHLKYLGRDSWDRPVYMDDEGIIWKDVDPRAERKANLCTSVDNEFDGEPDTGMKIVADKITTHPELELPIETLAADIFVSKYYLIKKFKSSIGMTPHQFCIQNRIRKSQGLLDEEKTVSRIAAEMGFFDQSHFDKAFQRIVGISPSECVRSKKRIAQCT